MGWVACGFFRSVRRTAGSVEEVADIIANRVARPLSNMPALAEVVKTVFGLVQQYRLRERRDEDGNEEIRSYWN